MKPAQKIVMKGVVTVGAVGVLIGSVLPSYAWAFRFELPHHAPSTMLAASASTGSCSVMLALPDHLEYTPGAASNAVILNLTNVAELPTPPSVR